MRKLLALTLVSYLLAFSMPFMVLAAEEGPTKICPFGSTFLVVDTSVADSNDSGSNSDEIEAAEAEEIEAYKEWLAKAQESYATMYSTSTCGKPNAYTQYLEKGDCSADGKVVTEITEVIAPDVLLDEDGDGKAENEVVTVYGGLCCTLQKQDQNGNILSCEQSSTFYADTYEKCETNLHSCEKRQWVIGSSGIGIVKLMVKQIFTFGVLAVGSVAVGTIVFQGIKISVSGVSGDITESKNKILQAIAGIVLLFLSGLILYAINPTFFGP